VTYKYIGIGAHYPLRFLAGLAQVPGREVIAQPIRVFGGNLDSHTLTINVNNLSLNIETTYFGELTSFHTRDIPPKMGHAFGFVHPQFSDVTIFQFQNSLNLQNKEFLHSWYEGFIPLLDDSRPNFTYHQERLKVLRMLSQRTMGRNT